MSSRRDDTDLDAALSALRPAPRPEFAAALDARVAAGFPRRTPGEGSAIRRGLAKLRATPPPRLLLPAGGFALVAIAVSTAVIAGSEDGGAGAGDAGQRPPDVATKAIGRAGAGAAAGTGGSVESQTRHSPMAAPSTSSGAGEAESGVVFEASAPARSGPYAADAGNRDIERSASIVLGTERSKVRADSARVFEAVHAANGIVLHSTIRDGSHGDGGASFDLLIPTARLNDALAAFSGIAQVRSRHESTGDITAPTVGAEERLQDSHARIESLLAQLAGAETSGERARAEVELRSERRRAAVLRSRAHDLHRRANLSHVSLRIETGAATARHGGGGGWGIDDGLAAAGRILAIAAGVAVIGLATLAPIALLLLLAWLARRAWLSASRRHALRGA